MATRNKYESEIRAKNLEITNLGRQHLKDSIRLAYGDLGDIHYNYGYLTAAISLWEKSYDNCMASDDKLKLAQQIIVAAFELSHSFYLTKYSKFVA